MAHQIAMVLCRFGAVLLWSFALIQFGYAIPGLFYGSTSPGWSELVFVVTAAAPVVAGIVLWVFAEAIANAISATDQSDVSPAPLSDMDILRTGTALIGVYLVASGIITATSVEVTNMAMGDFGPEFQQAVEQNTARNMGRRAAYLAEIVLGLALFFGRERLASIYTKAKRAGVDTG